MNVIEIKCSSINSIRLDFEAILLLPDLWLYSHDNNPDSVQSSPPECFGNFEENCSDRINFENCYDFSCQVLLTIFRPIEQHNEEM